MKLALVLCLLITFGTGLLCPSLSRDQDIKALFYRWMGQYDRVYQDRAELEQRFDIFARNVDWIEQHNQNSPSYCTQINQFADMSGQEVI